MLWHKFELTLPRSTASMDHWLIYCMLPDPLGEYHHRCGGICVFDCGCVCVTEPRVILLPYQRLISTPSALPVMLSVPFIKLWLQACRLSAWYERCIPQCVCFLSSLPGDFLMVAWKNIYILNINIKLYSKSKLIIILQIFVQRAFIVDDKKTHTVLLCGHSYSKVGRDCFFHFNCCGGNGTLK